MSLIGPIMAEVVEVRCPANPRRLFLRLAVGESPGDGMLEVACRACRDDARARGEQVGLVLHRFTAAGALVETVTVATRPR